VGEVNPDDDSVRRFIVRRYRYDPARHERRHLVVAAFDNEIEFRACLNEVDAELRRRRGSCASVDPREHVSGVIHESGYRRRQHNARMLARAMKHGVLPANWDGLDLPPSVGILRAGMPERSIAGWRRVLRRLRLRR